MSLSPLSPPLARATLSAEEICSSLQRIIPTLSEFGGKEEVQFVLIGHHLADFVQRSRSISRSSTKVVDSLLRQEGDEVFAALSALMDSLEHHIVQLQAAAHAHEEVLQKVTLQIHRIEAPLTSLAKVVKILHSLSFSTKVESTQGHSAVVLHALADDLSALAIKINAKTDAVRDRLKIMLALVQTAKEKTQFIAGVALGQARRQLLQCRRVVAGVGQRRAAALVDAQLLQGDSTILIAALDEIISSIQFHDITRQQVDHVQRALADFCGRLAGEGGAAHLCQGTGGMNRWEWSGKGGNGW